jgi:NAD-dependent SIR2 family protein deacetylase
MHMQHLFFGEIPYHMDRIEAALAQADLFVSIGTSGAVYPGRSSAQSNRAPHAAHKADFNAPCICSIRVAPARSCRFPYHMDRIEAALAQADLFVSIGTSGAVYPAAGFVRMAPAARRDPGGFHRTSRCPPIDRD